MGIWSSIHCEKWNESHLSGPHNCKLTPTVIINAMNQKHLKQGHPKVIPSTFMHALAIQSTMMQVTASSGKACGKNMMAIIKAMTDEMIWEGKFDA